ncbi:MAG: segregation/condensation protein A [Bdellovibrionales bacterium]|nr:segregation/condensation protein A [Bdellovibrionales bacterium]
MSLDTADDYTFSIALEIFHGPIDLLLHLVKQNELPIEKLSLAQVANQYLICLERMRRLDLEVAGEYLVVAATLLSIKASTLLSDPIETPLENDESELDPHDELLLRLREAEVYKEGANTLANMDLLDVDVFAGKPILKYVPDLEAGFVDHDPYLLGKAFRALLEKASDEDKASLKITLESVSIVERMVDIMQRLKGASGVMSFEALVPDRTSKSSIIGTFLGLLELAKRQIISVSQEEVSSEIVIALRAEEDRPDSSAFEGFSSEFDEPTLAAEVNGSEASGLGESVNG